MADYVGLDNRSDNPLYPPRANSLRPPRSRPPRRSLEGTWANSCAALDGELVLPHLHLVLPLEPLQEPDVVLDVADGTQLARQLAQELAEERPLAEDLEMDVEGQPISTCVRLACELRNCRSASCRIGPCRGTLYDCNCCRTLDSSVRILDMRTP